MNPLDEIDQAILERRQSLWDENQGARVGDFVIMPDGDTRRFTHDWHDGLQTTLPKTIDGSFYLGQGFISFSGGLDPIIPRIHLLDIGKTELGRVWFFHHNEQRAHNAVHPWMKCRVFECHGSYAMRGSK